jgi:hypothetical protein
MSLFQQAARAYGGVRWETWEGAMKEFRTMVLLCSVFFLSGLIGGCAATLTDPIGPESSLVIGRIVITNNYSGKLGLMPMGTVEQGIVIEIKNKNGTLVIRAITDNGGYFVVPNIPLSTYFLNRVIFKGGNPGDEETMYLGTNKGAFFVPVRGQIVDLGTFLLDISDQAEVTPKYHRPNPKATKAYLTKRHEGTPWLKRKFNP